MKRKKIGNYLSAVICFLIAIWLLDFDNPDKLFGAFLSFLASIQALLQNGESDYYRRFSYRLSRVILFLTLFFLIKLWLSV